jgi:hypothetical protein
MLRLEVINPSNYEDWDSILLSNNNPSFFHTSVWAKVLEETYQFKPTYFILFDEKGRLALSVPLMEVSSFLTGRRGVSLPFTDECVPYVLSSEILEESVRYIIRYGENAQWRYIEWRDSAYFSKEVSPWTVYYTHNLNLLRSESELLSLLRDNNRRNIKKGIKEGVSIKIDQSLDSLKSFYLLHCATRKRHGLPPQPFSFFRNIFSHVISKGYGIIVSASHSERVVAASIFFHFGRRAIYKYGASDMRCQSLRPNNLIMWEAIKWYRNRDFENLNFGRTELENSGLLQYKRMWGAAESSLMYYRYDLRKETFLQNRPKGGDFQKRLFTQLPSSVLRIIGSLAYKHMA